MSFSVKYKELFRVEILHRYFLNKGTLEFDDMSEENQAKQMRIYNFNRFFKIIPATADLRKLSGRKMVFSQFNSGFGIWAETDANNPQKPLIPIEDSFNLTFIIQVSDNNFLNYTNLELGNARKLHYFSNQRLSSENPGFPLIPLKNLNEVADDTFVLSADSEAEELKQLSAEKQKNLFGIIRIFMKGQNASHDITDAQGNLKANTPTFKLEFLNRSTVWRYIFDTNQSVKPPDNVKVENGDPRVLVTKTKKPLTQNGFITVELDGEELPNPDVRLIKPSSVNNKIFSEIIM
ncbi:MAG: hypothetical protein ACQETJ_08650 [Bacteroidota bacterium]